jgi:hypothetical protein
MAPHIAVGSRPVNQPAAPITKVALPTLQETTGADHGAA